MGQSQDNSWQSTFKQLVVFLVFIAIAMMVGRQLNTWLGQRALDNTGVTHLSMEQALARSAETGKPLLVKFAALWCGGCRQLDNQVFSDTHVKQLLDSKFHYVRLEYTDDNDRAWFQRYGVNGFPRLMLLDSRGSLIRNLPVPRTGEQFVDELNR